MWLQHLKYKGFNCLCSLLLGQKAHKLNGNFGKLRNLRGFRVVALHSFRKGQMLLKLEVQVLYRPVRGNDDPEDKDVGREIESEGSRGKALARRTGI